MPGSPDEKRKGGKAIGKMGKSGVIIDLTTPPRQVKDDVVPIVTDTKEKRWAIQRGDRVAYFRMNKHGCPLALSWATVCSASTRNGVVFSGFEMIDETHAVRVYRAQRDVYGHPVAMKCLTGKGWPRLGSLALDEHRASGAVETALDEVQGVFTKVQEKVGDSLDDELKSMVSGVLNFGSDNITEYDRQEIDCVTALMNDEIELIKTKQKRLGNRIKHMEKVHKFYCVEDDLDFDSDDSLYDQDISGMTDV